MRTQIEMWKEDVWDKQDEIDPEKELYWNSLALGYFLGLGLSIEDAHESVREAGNQAQGWM
jgi:hypothetical protein